MSKAGGRPKDEHWSHVKAEKDGKWTCIYCGKVFSGKTSVTRIKAHLNKEKGQGIAACSFDRHNEGVHSNMASGPSNPQEEGAPHRIDAIESDPLPTEEGAPHRIDTNVVSGSINPHIESDPLPAEGVTEGRCIRSASKSEIHQLINQLHLDLQREESDIKEMESRGRKRKPGVVKWMEELQKLKKRAVDMNNLGDVEIHQLIQKMQWHKDVKPVTLSTEFVGRALDANIKKVFNLLEDEQVFVIGIYGMGGVGKTFLVTHVETEVKRKGTFKNVFWVTVSHNFSISRLQHDIAKRMGIKLEEDDDERIRAANLSEALETKEKSILILDDVWKYIDLQKVGIPLKENGIKVILTTRLKHVCQQMDCLPNNMIQMLPLEDSDDEAEELFKVKLGHNGTPATLPPEVQEIATCIVKRFGGLPLGISVMARTMKGLDDIHRWKHTWNKLETGEEVQEEVFKVLKRSYDNLMEKDLQKCFLHCALLPKLGRDELIMELVDNGLINGRRSLEEIFVEGKTILDKLEAHSLLQMEKEYDVMRVRVYRSVTDMACRILKESQRCVMVKFPKEKELTKISHIQEWEDLELVNLMPCYISEIPEGTSPCCPRLSTLIIGGSWHYSNHISHIPDCFFRNMNALTVLNLSNNDGLESLPNSLSELRSLVSLVLKRCRSLKDVPPLGELQALSRLDISYCSIEKVPQGLEKLINLKWLDLSYNKNLTMGSGFVDVLPNLTSMQYLDLHCCPDVKIKVEDVRRMDMLECFGGTFLNCIHYNHYVENILDKGFGPKTYSLLLGNFYSNYRDFEFYSILPGDPKTKNIFLRDCEDFSHSHILPKDLTDLCIYNNQWICLCEALSSKAASSLRKIKVSYCEQLKSVFCSSYSCSLCTKFQNLEIVHLRYLASLTVICKEDVADVRQSLSMGVMFSCLKYFHIFGCNEIKKLLTPWLVLQLPNLERITVEDCDSMEEIFAVGNGDDNDGSSVITLPKLTTLELRYLPELKTVSKRLVLQLPNLEWITVEDCDSMEEIFAVGNGDDNDGSSVITLPKLTTLELRHLPQLKTVSKRLVLQLPNLERITVEDCDSMEEIFAVGNGDDNDGSSVITLPKLTTLELVDLPQLKTVSKRLVLQLPNLERITVEDCDSMEEIFAVGNGDDNDGSSVITLPKLTTLELVDLPQLKTMFKRLVLQLPNLERRIAVVYCCSMEEIFAVGNGDGSGIMLPKLTTLELWHLPQLKTVCKGNISLGSSRTFEIEDCPNFKLELSYNTIPTRCQ